MNTSDRRKDRRNVGQVVFPIEQLMTARALSSCCAGQETMLESCRILDVPRDSEDWRPTGSA